MFVDDCLHHVLKEKKYSNWSKPCHYGKQVLNVNQDGTVTGCSFDYKVLFKIDDPRDVLKLNSIVVVSRYYCPYILR